MQDDELLVMDENQVSTEIDQAALLAKNLELNKMLAFDENPSLITRETPSPCPPTISPQDDRISKGYEVYKT